MTTRPKIAIVGSGIGGLSMAYILSHPSNGFDVTIYEANHRLGMDSQSILFEGPSYADGTFDDYVGDHVARRDGGQDIPQFSDCGISYNSTPSMPQTTHVNPSFSRPPRVRIDMPLRVFSPRYYPHLTALFDAIGIKYCPEDYQSSFSSQGGDTIFRYRNLLLGSLSLPYINPIDLLTKPVTRDIIKFLATVPHHLRTGRLQIPEGYVTADNMNSLPNTPTSPSNPQTEETLLEYLITEGYSDEFIYQFELPTVASICTCSLQAAANYPAYIVLSYQMRRSGGGVRRVESGANYVVKMLSQYARVKCNACVVQISHLSLNANNKVSILDSNGERELYDNVIFATQANQTAKILCASIYGSSNPNNDPGGILPTMTSGVGPTSIHPLWDEACKVLKRIPYESSELVLHGDVNLMPKQLSEWKNVNFILPDSIAELKGMIIPRGDSENGNQDDVIIAEDETSENEQNCLENPEDCGLIGIASSLPSGPSSESDIIPSTPPNLTKALSQRWLSAISAQPSVRSQRLAMCDARYVSQNEGMSTIWMNKVQNGLNSTRNIFQTWNPLLPSTPNQTPYEIQYLYGRSFFQRPVVTFDSTKATYDLWAKYQGIGGVYFIGSYSVGGIPLLELAVVSALAVSQRLKAKNILTYNTTNHHKNNPFIPQPTSSSVALTNIITTYAHKIPIIGQHRYIKMAACYFTTTTFAAMLIELMAITVFCVLSTCGVYKTSRNSNVDKSKQD